MNPKGLKSVITVTIISGDTAPITSAPKKCSLFKACLKGTGTHRIWGKTSQFQTPMWQHTVGEWGRFPSHSKICPLLTYAYPQINTPLGAGRAKAAPKQTGGRALRWGCAWAHTLRLSREATRIRAPNPQAGPVHHTWPFPPHLHRLLAIPSFYFINTMKTMPAKM